jgi:hypothetical protein
MFEKTSPSGIFPFSLLKDRFKVVKSVKLQKEDGNGSRDII